MKNPLKGMLMGSYPNIKEAAMAAQMSPYRLRRIAAGRYAATPAELLRLADACGCSPGDVCEAAAETQRQAAKKETHPEVAAPGGGSTADGI